MAHLNPPFFLGGNKVVTNILLHQSRLEPVLTWVSFMTTFPPSAAVTTRSTRILAFLLQLLQTHFSQHQNALTQVYRTRRRSHVHVLYVSFPLLHHLPFLVILFLLIFLSMLYKENWYYPFSKCFEINNNVTSTG